MNDLRVLFMGTPDFALPSCKALDEKFRLVGVVTQPDRPKGRGGKMAAPPVKEYALERGIPCWQPTVLKDGSFQSVLDETKPDLIVVAAYGRILPAYILDYPRYGCINVHGSLLPKYRGAAPIQRAVINGEAETGITIMRMALGMDTGDMILQEKTPILESDTAGTLFDRLAVMGAAVLLKAIEQIVNGTAVYIPQEDALATHAPMIEKAEGLLSLQKPAEELRNLIMGLSPSPGAFFEFENYRLKVYEAALGPKSSLSVGTISAISSEGIAVTCGNGTSLLLKVVQKQGKNKTDAYSYACGAKLAVGEYLK
ncbi:MAG: methionyl-tRNA formyltransferase [Clostridia bacterium]|nr:methionyl-tRNA formyltransferase [Clostridia bacterium]